MFVSNFANTWFKPSHSLFFLKQYWYRFRYKFYFDKIEKFPLTVKQRQSIIVDEARNLIIAGAGTGKTSTVVGKVGFLVKTKRAKPHEILAIAYNRNAAQELKDRISDKVKVDIAVGTFHSIGKAILNGSKYPSRPHPFVDQEEKLFEYLNKILERCLRIGDFYDLYLEYFKKYEFRNVDEVKDFKTEREYANWLRFNKLITLNNEKVKSHGELLIANYLFSNGIQYQYEPFYTAPNSINSEINYRPDFYLPEHEIYIEYFGIDRSGGTAEFVPQDQYHSSMNWKFETHKREQTKLIDLYFYQKKEGTLLDELEKRLNKANVPLRPIPREKLFKTINGRGKDKKFLKLVQNFLSQFKERQNVIQLQELKQKSKDDPRTTLFLKLFEILLNAYQNELTKRKRIDFGDMISLAANLISENADLSKYKYIIIDEFQDISQGRYDLIKQLILQNKKTKLFCVGDDWQAIYRFAGSDHQIMTNFQSLFGETTTLMLDTTFRYNNQIASVSEQFITKNPNQIRKDLKTLSSKFEPQVFVHWHSDDALEGIRAAIKEMKRSYKTSQASLLILSRYNDSKFEGADWRKIKELWGNDKISQRSVHSSKGLEADFVVVSDLKADHLGFPSEIQDDPILNLVLSQEDSFLDSEERRLFYVALTRAKNQTHLVCDATCPSRFAEELTNSQYDVCVTGEANNSKKCPACSDGVLTKKHGMYGEFVACNNYPLCDFKPLKCQSCEADIVLREKVEDNVDIAVCQSPACKTSHEPCFKCDHGVMRTIESSSGPFSACHEFFRTNCKATKQIQKTQPKSDFEKWAEKIETAVLKIAYSDTIQFESRPILNRKLQSLRMEVCYKKGDREFQLIMFSLEKNDNHLKVPASISMDNINTKCKTDQEVMNLIEGEIRQRKILLDLPEK